MVSILTPLAAGVIAFGIYPSPVLKLTETAVANIISAYDSNDVAMTADEILQMWSEGKV